MVISTNVNKLNVSEKNIDDSKILFFTSATNFYNNFVTPYIYFAAKHNDSAAFEFIVDDLDSFCSKHEKSLVWLKKHLRVKIQLRSSNELETKPAIDNSIRFIMEPKLKSEYVYIGDVDIIIFDDILSVHSPVFAAGLPYSNVVRSGKKQLTGLHLCKSKTHYPLGNIKDLVEKIKNDEELLYAIVERKGLLHSENIRNNLGVGRPIHGIHLSLNRLPFSYSPERVGWGLSFEYLEKFNNICKSEEFVDFYKNLYQGSQHILLNLIYLSYGSMMIGFDNFEKIPPSK